MVESITNTANDDQEEVEMTYGEFYMYAARTGDLEGMKECIAEGVPLNYQDSLGNTALHMACANRFEAIVVFLLDQRADVNIQNESKNTALHWAALNGHLAVLKLLCENKSQDVNVSLKNQFGRIPMEEALQSCKSEIAEYLAPLSKLEDGKLYSEIPECQVFAPEEEVKDDRSFVSEEAIRNDEYSSERAYDLGEHKVLNQDFETQKLKDLGQELKEKLNMHEFDVQVTKID